MYVPNVQHAEVAESKVVDYLLDTTHPEGRDKANFFLRFGFSPDRWEEFAYALRLLATSHEVTNTIASQTGLRYQVDGTLKSPDGRNPRIRTIWQINTGSSIPRLITAYPARR